MGAEYSACSGSFYSKVELVRKCYHSGPFTQHHGPAGTSMSSQPTYKVIFHNGGQYTKSSRVRFTKATCGDL